MRISDTTAFFLLGSVVESGPAKRLFSAPTDERTAAYLDGRFG